MVIVFDAKVQREQRSQRAATAKPGGGGQWRRVFVGILSDSQALNIAQNARRPKGIMKRRRAKASFCVTACNERSSHRGVAKAQIRPQAKKSVRARKSSWQIIQKSESSNF